MVASGVAALALVTGCNVFGWGGASPEGIIKPSLKPYQPPVLAPVSDVTPVPFVPDPPMHKDTRTGQLINDQTGAIVHGTAKDVVLVAAASNLGASLAGGHATIDASKLPKVPDGFTAAVDPATGQPIQVAGKDGASLFTAVDLTTGGLVTLPDLAPVLDGSGKQVLVNGDTVLNSPVALPSALPSSDPKAALKTADGTRVQYIDAGNTLFLETTGLTPNTDYQAKINWPGPAASPLVQDAPFKSDAGGNIDGPSGKFLEFPHTGLFHLQLAAGKSSLITGDFRVDLLEKASQKVVQQVYFHVRPRPLIVATNASLTENTVFFSDRPDEIHFHGEGLPANSYVTVSVIKSDVNRFNALADGTTIQDKLFENLHDLRYHTNAQGVFDERVMAWGTRTPIDNSLVVIGKYLNSEPTFVANEDTAIIDHPTFVIKDGIAYFAAVRAAGELLPASPQP